MLILASDSPRRKEILKKLGYTFKVVPSRYQENNNHTTDPIKLVINHATEKAKDVAKTNKGIILGFDTIVSFKKEIIGKPKDIDDAKNILKRLSGNTHKVITAFAIIDNINNRTIIDHDSTTIRFRKLTNHEITTYVESENTLDKAGAYAIQGSAFNFVQSIEGDYYNIVGFPIYRFIKSIKRFDL